MAFTVFAFILLLPLILPTALVLHGIYLHRLRSVAGRFVCTGCGYILGRQSLRLADIECGKRLEEMRSKYPGIKFRMVREVHAICSKCGKQYRFFEHKRSFEEVLAKPTNT